jgi:hypothetical protein
MPQGFWVKTKGDINFQTVTRFFVKVSPSTWQTVSDAWVKVKQTGTDAWRKFWTSATNPDSPIEIITSYDSSDRLRIQGKNYHWTPTPSTLFYTFTYVNNLSVTKTLTSSTSTSNPSSGLSITVPSSTTYRTISKNIADDEFVVGGVSTYKFNVTGTTSGGLSATSTAEFQMRTPRAPNLSVQQLSNTSVRITISAFSSDDYIATNRYIVSTYDAIAGTVESGGGRGGYGATTNPIYVTLTGLTAGRLYYIYVTPFTGYAGSTEANATGYKGLAASITSQGTAAATSPTSITATNNGSYDTVSISWSGASNASYYRVRWFGAQDTSIDPSVYYDKQITAANATSGSWNWGPGDPDKDNVVPYPGVDYYYHVSSSIDGTIWSPYTVSSTAVGTLTPPAPTIISGLEPVNTNTSGTRNFSVTNGSWNNSPTGYSYQWKAFTYVSYPPYTSTINVGTNSSSYSGSSTYDGYSIYCVVTATNAGGSTTATSNSITQVTPGVAPSGGSVTLTPSGTQMAGTAISANVTAMSGTSPITYTTTIRKATGSSPTGSATAVASGTGTGNGVASHTITDGEASGTPDQFKAYTVGTNDYGSFTVGSNTVISTPYVAPVTAPADGTASVDPTTGTAGTTTYTGSTTGWTGSAATFTYSWQYFSQSSFSYVQYTSGTSFSPPANINTAYPNYGWRFIVTATNSAGSAVAAAYFTVNSPAVVTAPGTPINFVVNSSGLCTWQQGTGGTPDSYEILFYTAQDSTGLNRGGPYDVTGISGGATSYQLSSPYASPNNWVRAQIRARNTGGVSTYGAWWPSSTTYV